MGNIRDQAFHFFLLFQIFCAFPLPDTLQLLKLFVNFIPQSISLFFYIFRLPAAGHIVQTPDQTVAEEENIPF